MATSTLSHHAYLGVILHSAKYPHKPVNGLLLGMVDGSQLTIQQSVPLLHVWTTLSPMMEIGIDLVSSYAKSQQLQVVGYYQAAPTPNDDTLGAVGEAILKKLRQETAKAISVLVQLDKLYQDGTDSTVPGILSSTPIQANDGGSVTQIRSLVETDLASKYVDFDDHLEQVELDWLRNAQVYSSVITAK